MQIVGRMFPIEEKSPPLESDEYRRDPLTAQSKPREKLKRAMRMNTFEVADVLKRGKRIRVKPAAQTHTKVEFPLLKPIIEARTLARNNAVTPTELVKYRVASAQIGVRLAAAIPKRLLKKSVDRNLVKRWIREAVRRHADRFTCRDLLLTLTGKFNPNNPDERAQVKHELAQVITDALSPVNAAPKPQRLPSGG